MTGVELIVAALAAGATAGLSTATGTAIGDAYTGLKRLLSRRLAGHRGAPEALDAHETEPGVWQARLGADLVDSGADADADVLAAARQLLALVDGAKYRVDLREARGVQVGDGNTQTNTFS
jgi:hypothetical protein